MSYCGAAGRRHGRKGVCGLAPPRTIAEGRELFPHAAGYLDTASVGLPPTTVGDALRAAVAEWERGRAAPPDYDAFVDTSREVFARLMGVPTSAVAVGSQVSGFVGLVAASLPTPARVVCPEGEFTSVLFPFPVRPPDGVEVVSCPLEGIADRIEEGHVELVAFSAVQSADGRVADLEAIAEDDPARGGHPCRCHPGGGVAAH